MRHGRRRGSLRRTTSEKGILRPDEAAENIDLRRYPAAADLGRFMERYWSVHWHLPAGRSYPVRLISHPCVNVTFQPELGGHVHGVGTTTSTHPVAGAGWVFGVKFRPGGFYGYAGRPVALLTDQSLPIGEVFGAAGERLVDAVASAGDDARRVELVQEFLRHRLPDSDDPTYARLVDMVAAMLDDRTITRVDQVAERFGVSVRTLQRVFHRYVGVGPKWMIRRYRLHDGAEMLAEGNVPDLAALAVSLGWFDQAHFTRDFHALVGSSPMEYAAACAAATDREPVALLPAG